MTEQERLAELKELSSSVDFWGTTTGYLPDELCRILAFAVESAEQLETVQRELEEAKRFNYEGASMLCGQYDELAAAMGWSSDLAEKEGLSQLEYARQLKQRTALQDEPAVPDGWKLVPIEATPDMLNASWDHHGIYHPSAYRTMVAVAPTPGGELV